MLADYQAQRREIPLNGTTFFVSGVTFNGLTQLLTTHFEDLDALFSLVKTAVDGDLSNIEASDVERIALGAVADAPGFVANLIAVAAGETSPKAVMAAGSISAPKQIEILMTIVKLTFEEVGGIKKGMEVIAPLLNKAKK